jgi:hypothetical protein
MHHFGNPCIHCDMPQDAVPVGPCQGDKSKVRPVSYCSMGVRWDGVERFRVMHSDGAIVDHWAHASEHKRWTDFAGLRHDRNLPWLR